MFLESRFTFMNHLEDSYVQKDKKSEQLEWATQERASATSKLQTTPSQRFTAIHPEPQEYKEPAVNLILNCGLCVVLWLTIANSSDVEVKNADASNIYGLILTYMAAWLLTLAIKIVIALVAKISYRHELSINRDFAWWKKQRIGNPAIFFSLVVFGMEWGFGLPGVFAILPPMSQSNHLLVFAAVAGSGLCAAINIALGYHTGIAQGRADAQIREWREKLQSIESSPEESECVRRNNIYQETIVKCDEMIVYLKEQISQLDYQIERLEWHERNAKPQDLGFKSSAPAPAAKSQNSSDRNGRVESPERL
jgi:hypothetical protein